MENKLLKSRKLKGLHMSNLESFIEDPIDERLVRRVRRAREVEIAMAAPDGAAAVDPNAERQQEQ